VAANPESILLTGPPFGRRCFRTRNAWQHQDTENEKEPQHFSHRTFSLELLYVESSQNYRCDALTRQTFVRRRREDVVDNLVSRAVLKSWPAHVPVRQLLVPELRFRLAADPDERLGLSKSSIIPQ
jgi:hypothetical protein